MKHLLKNNPHVDRVKEIVKDEDVVLMIAASTEADITELDSMKNAKCFLRIWV